MARRPENGRNRGPRSGAPLDWLKQPDPQADGEPGVDDGTPEASPSVPLTLSRRAARAGTARAGTGRAGTGRAGTDRRRVAFWLTVAAGLLGLWSASTFIDSGNPMIATLAALSPVVSVLALPVIAVGVASRHLVAAVVAIAAAFVPWTLVVGYAAAGPGMNTADTGPTLRVMSVDGGRGRASAANIVQVARTYSADVVVVTGLTSELAHELTVAGLSTQATAQWVQVPDGSTDGTGVWSRTPIEGLRQITELTRPGVQGTIEAGRQTIGISVVQLDGGPLNRSSTWHGDLARLARAPATQPGFLIGDLGATPWQPAFRRLTAAGWHDAADVAGHGLRPTWPSWSPIPITPLDHVLVSRGVGVSNASTTNITGSSHRALIVTLVLPSSGN